MTANNHTKLLGENLAATKDLTKQVKDLKDRLSAKEILHKRILRLGVVAVFISMISILGLCLSGYVLYQNSNNARINCLNANESRKFNLQLWTFIIVSEMHDNQNTIKETEMIEKLPPYLDAAWRPRDCNDLSKRYPIPDPPLPIQ